MGLAHIEQCLCNGQERWWFALAPANMRSPKAVAALVHFAAQYAARKVVTLDVLVPKFSPRNADELFVLEDAHSVRAACVPLLMERLPLACASLPFCGNTLMPL